MKNACMCVKQPENLAKIETARIPNLMRKPTVGFLMRLHAALDPVMKAKL